METGILLHDISVNPSSSSVDSGHTGASPAGVSPPSRGPQLLLPWWRGPSAAALHLESNPETLEGTAEPANGDACVVGGAAAMCLIFQTSLLLLRIIRESITADFTASFLADVLTYGGDRATNTISSPDCLVANGDSKNPATVTGVVDLELEAYTIQTEMVI